MRTLRILGKYSLYYIGLYLAISFLVITPWQPFLIRLTGIAISVLFIIAVLQMILGEAAWYMLGIIGNRIFIALLAIVAVTAVVGFGYTQISHII